MNKKDCVLTEFGNCSYSETGCSDCKIKAKIRNALSAQSEQRWISCKTGILPEEKDEFYQATYLLNNGERMVDYIYFTSEGVWSNYSYEESELLAWMPLPEPYREEGD